MSACRVCGEELPKYYALCESCCEGWNASLEARRRGTDDIEETALMDFINRARAERQNGGQP